MTDTKLRHAVFSVRFELRLKKQLTTYITGTDRVLCEVRTEAEETSGDRYITGTHRVLCEVQTGAEETSDDRCITEIDIVLCEVRTEAEEGWRQMHN